MVDCSDVYGLGLRRTTIPSRELSEWVKKKGDKEGEVFKHLNNSKVGICVTKLHL